ncbi:uncharacterized protein LOC125664181 [Ostrea edulis]|uniref:uncharacterized protein LOC125664181 n=1 Tax=Ostrea edulis TaxID=37623 RepID=UPI00209622C5|nr:uncharacterized protein LOC125664181 [Ostrea edulis]
MMKVHTCILAAIFFGQISKIEGFPSDDEDLWIEGSGSGSGSGSGAGCFQIPPDKNCTCSTLFDCVQTCSDLECDLTLVDCLDGDVYGNCRSRLNSMSTLDEKPNAVNTETTLIIAGSVGAIAIVLIAAIIIFIFAFRKMKYGGTGRGERGIITGSGSQPQLLKQDQEPSKTPAGPVGNGRHANHYEDSSSRSFEKSAPNIV